MKKQLLSVFVIAAAMLCNTANAQYSLGGKPYSFTAGVEKHALNYVNMPSFDLDALRAQDAINDQSKGPFRFGYNHMVSLNLSNSGEWTTLANGDRIWKMGVKSKDAQTINLAFDDFFMPEGASFFVYNEDKTFVIGAITNHHNQADRQFATDLIPGEAVVLEYYEPAAVVGQGKISVFRVTHGYRGVEDYVRNFGGEFEKTFGASGSCQINVNCPYGTGWSNEKRSVVCLVSGGSEFCTGALVTDVPSDRKPYVLTANHCGTTGLGSWVFRFNWEAPGCSDPGSSPSTAQSLTGGVLRGTSAASDFTLAEITGGLVGGTVPAAYNPFFAGWNNSATAADSGRCIHHPSGDIKTISGYSTPPTSAAWSGSTLNHWFVQWTAACTEPGSSGSPLFDQNHRVIGQLHGGASACGVATGSMNDLYGKFSVSWLGGGTAATQLKAWLDPSNTGAVTTNGVNLSATAITSVDAKEILNVYPNPSAGSFNVEIKLTSTEAIVLKVMNVLGEVVSTTALTNVSYTTYPVDLSAQPAGIYFVEVSSATEKATTKISLVK